MLASLSMNTGSPSRSAIRSRIGTLAIGRLTEVIASPRSRSIVHGIPSPIAARLRTGVERLAQLALERLEQLVELEPDGRLGATMEDVPVGVDDPDGHLRPSEISADRSPQSCSRQDSPKGMRY